MKKIGDAKEEYDSLSVESNMGDSSGDVENLNPQPDNLPSHLVCCGPPQAAITPRFNSRAFHKVLSLQASSLFGELPILLLLALLTIK